MGPNEEWQLVRELGGGGQSYTSEVISASGKIRGVLKRIRTKGDEKAISRAKIEVVSLEQLKEQGAKVPRVLAKYFEAGNACFVMEFIDGMTLREFIEGSGPVPLDDALDLAIDLLETIRIGGALGIVHRDLKPDNIMYRGPGDLVVLDYGLANNSSVSADLTESDEVMGSRFLILPEQRVPGANGRSFVSDLTSVCAVLFYCFTGVRPGVLVDDNGLPAHRRSGPARVRIESLATPIRIAIDSLFDRGFKHVHGLRYQSISELLDRLIKLRRGQHQADRPHPSVAAAESRERMMRRSGRARVADYERRDSDLHARFRNLLASESESIAPYRLSFNHVINSSLRLPDGYVNGNFRLRFAIQLPGLSAKSFVVDYVLAANGSEIAVLRRVTRSEDAAGIFSSTVSEVMEDEWTDVERVDAESGELHLEAVHTDARELICMAFEWLEVRD